MKTKRFQYTCSAPFASMTTDHQRRIINNGDIIEQAGKYYKIGKDFIIIEQDSIDKYFQPYYTDDELKFWNDFRNQAAVSAMQAIISLQNPKGCVNFDRIADLSVQAADALIKRLRI